MHAKNKYAKYANFVIHMQNMKNMQNMCPHFDEELEMGIYVCIFSWSSIMSHIYIYIYIYIVGDQL